MSGDEENLNGSNYDINMSSESDSEVGSKNGNNNPIGYLFLDQL